MCGGKRWSCKVAVRLAEPVQIDLKASKLGLKKVGPRQMRGPFLHLIKLLKDSLYRFLSRLRAFLLSLRANFVQYRRTIHGRFVNESGLKANSYKDF